MKLGAFAVLFVDILEHVQNAGVESIEISTGGYPGDAHCNVDELLVSDDKPRLI